ncbi:hypothetical protein POM88_009227 [Heracleum sosnowskyi]|uniref:Glycosyl transferase family 1 domain-containing protein n=1 Tax=Heracleum sosnowskyi TaxID=360622 RepID=A0AAD8N7A4_9APIA|nr:hypothetical protein POM88_009227 [Heracleum sosnowskyi]
MISPARSKGLPRLPECPLIGFIARLDFQKGVDILSYECKFKVVLGCWEKEHEEWIAYAEPSLKERLRGRGGFSSPISHRIIAGCDILLIPSRFEPCGSNSMRSMRYGTIPVVHATGGIQDSVKNFNIDLESRDEGTGYVYM